MSSAILFNQPNSCSKKKKNIYWVVVVVQVKSGQVFFFLMQPDITPHVVSEGFTILCQFTGCKYLQTSDKTRKNI